MERSEALRRLNEIVGSDLVELATRHEVTMWKEGKLNKGWAGHVIERYLGLPLNSAQSPNFGSWELKVVPLKRLKDGMVVLKETMAVTMIDPVNVVQKPFDESHLLAKLKKLIVCARMFESREETSSELVSVAAFDLDDAAIYDQIQADYDEVRRVIEESGFDALTGHMGVLVQPRTKGAKNSTSRAFYARKLLLSKIVGVRATRES